MLRVIALERARDTAEMRFFSRGREKSNDEGRFNKRCGKYIKNMKSAREHYTRLIEMVRIFSSLLSRQAFQFLANLHFRASVDMCPE